MLLSPVHASDNEHAATMPPSGSALSLHAQTQRNHGRFGVAGRRIFIDNL
jgi:hypothetical protein